jgi:cysteine synthase B
MPAVTPGAPRTSSSVVDLIGDTPLVRLSAFEPGLRNVELWAKAEWRNPGGSVKDRPAARMIADGERSGALTRDKIIIDATSGNTGIAYAMIGAARGYRVRLCVPENVTPERKRILQAFGAEIVFTDPMQGSDGAIIAVKEMYAAEPHRYFYPDQYNNPGNWQAHYDTTAPEIIAQTEGRITHFVAGLGTSGTLMGVGTYLKEQRPDVKIMAVEPPIGERAFLSSTSRTRGGRARCLAGSPETVSALVARKVSKPICSFLATTQSRAENSR